MKWLLKCQSTLVGTSDTKCNLFFAFPIWNFQLLTRAVSWHWSAIFAHSTKFLLVWVWFLMFRKVLSNFLYRFSQFAWENLICCAANDAQQHHTVQQQWILCYFWNAKEKNLGKFSKNCWSFYPKNFQYALKYMGLGSGIRDPGSGKNLSPIPDLGVKRHRIPDPGSGSATLINWINHRISCRQLGVVLHPTLSSPRMITWKCSTRKRRSLQNQLPCLITRKEGGSTSKMK